MKENVISAQREIDLRMWLFDADIIIHESGVPPIHTSIEVLNSLPETLKEKMLIVHCSSIPSVLEKTKKDGTTYTIPITSLKIPKEGIENTISLKVNNYWQGFSSATTRLKLISDIFFFRNMTPPMLLELQTQSDQITFTSRQVILDYGAVPDSLYIVESGIVEIETNPPDSGAVVRKFSSISERNFLRTSFVSKLASKELSVSTPKKSLLFRGDIFGEAALREKKVPNLRPITQDTRATAKYG